MATKKPKIGPLVNPANNILEQGPGLPAGGGEVPKVTDAEILREQTFDATTALKEILKDMETQEGIERLKKGSLEFKIKPDPGVLWYVAYGT